MTVRSFAAAGLALVGAWVSSRFATGLVRVGAVLASAGAAAAIVYQSVRARSGVFVRLWGLTWTRDQFCSHFLITGATGTGKTSRALVPLLHAVRKQQPTTGVLAIDSKGVMWQPLGEICETLGQTADLRLIQVKRPETPANWQPPLRLNLLADRNVPWATYAKLVVDTATAAGQKGGQTFFKEAARDAIAHAMQALDEIDEAVTLENAHHVLCRSGDTQWLLQELRRRNSSEADYFADVCAQPPEQRAGTLSTIANYLRPYAVPAIADVFCSVEPNFSLAEIDAGRVICLSVPQAYQVERRYLNLLCKQLFFLHAFRRFDDDAMTRQAKNVITLVLDEGQKTTLLPEDGFADHNTVDELREAGVCVMSATQTPLSFYASFETEKKADVFMANLRTQIHFRAADQQGAAILSKQLGGRRIRKFSGGYSGGRQSASWQEADEPWFTREHLLALSEGVVVMKHPQQDRARRRRLRHLRPR